MTDEMIFNIYVSAGLTAVTCALYTVWAVRRAVRQAYDEGYNEGAQKGLNKGLHAQVTKIRDLQDGRFEVHWKDPDNDD